MNRRTLLRAGVGLTAALASGTSKTTTSTVACSCDSPSVEERLYCEKDACAAAAHDFGNIIHAMPRTVFAPTSTADVATAVRSAVRQGLQVAARGRGHSIYGRPMAGDGVVIDMRQLSTIIVRPDPTWR
jgi:FAD/FMN-containing dehydrogenase